MRNMAFTDCISR